MSRSDESKRRKDYCIECGRFMPIKAKNMCQNCWHKVKRKNDPNFFLRSRHSEIGQRCNNPNNQRSDIYGGKSVCSLDEFLDKFLNCSNFLKLFDNWKNNNHEYKLVPSIDRIDNNGDYTINNLQFITHSENCAKDSGVPIRAFDFYTKRVIKDFDSIADAAKELCVQHANIWKVLNKKREKTCGYYFEYI